MSLKFKSSYAKQFIRENDLVGLERDRKSVV